VPTVTITSVAYTAVTFNRPVAAKLPIAIRQHSVKDPNKITGDKVHLTND